MRKRSSVKTTAPVRSCSCWAYVLFPAQGSPEIKWAVDILVGMECYTTDGNATLYVALRPALLDGFGDDQTRRRSSAIGAFGGKRWRSDSAYIRCLPGAGGSTHQLAMFTT